MVFKSIIGVTCACLTSISLNSIAATINIAPYDIGTYSNSGYQINSRSIGQTRLVG